MPNFQKRSGSSTLSPENSSLRPYEMLIVEDSADDVELFLRALQKVQIDMDREIRPFAVSSGVEAATKILERKYDAIFLDINLPPPDGVELTRKIRASAVNRTTTVVVLTGAEDRGLMTRAFQAGANLFLSKPIDRGRLLRLIQVSSVPIDRERRRLQRVKVECAVTIESGQGRFNGKTVDLSLNGILARYNRVLPVGSAVNVTLALSPGEEPIRTAGRIVRVMGNDLMALTLEDVGSAESARLGEFLVPLIAAATKSED
ncbi:MAG TPA: response regulator [Bryobacteraceae bacterium]|nr:response regulator [Bryobacteraceae bacterium]